MNNPFRDEREAALARAEELVRDNQELREQVNSLQHGQRPASTARNNTSSSSKLIFGLAIISMLFLAGIGAWATLSRSGRSPIGTADVRTTVNLRATRESTGIAGVVRAVQTAGESWAAGEHGAIAYRSREGVWQVVQSGVSTTLRAVAQHGSDVVAVGEMGTVLRYDPNAHQWQRIESGTRADLRTVAWSSGYVFFVAGSAGTLLQCNTVDATCTPTSSGVSTDLNAIAFSANRGRFFAVGDRGVILTWGNTTPTSVTRQMSPTDANLLSVVVRVNGDIVAVGSAGTMISSERGGDLPWVRQQAPNDRDLMTVIEADVSIEQRYEHGSSNGPHAELVVLASDGTLFVGQQDLSHPAPPWHHVSDVSTGVKALSRTSDGFVVAGLAGQVTWYQNDR
jgi:photosystem II stability/assembly factor-like uncharacterized protein